MPAIYGYARDSTDEQVANLNVQVERITLSATTLAARTGLAWDQCYAEIGSAICIRWNKRPEFVKLKGKLQRGDHLFLWRLDRIDRNPFAMIEAVRWLVESGIVVHTLQEKGGESLNLDTASGRALVWAMAMVSDIWVEQLKESTSEACRWRRDNGYRFSYAIPPCHKIELVDRGDGRGGVKRPLQRFVWDEQGIAAMTELTGMAEGCTMSRRAIADKLNASGRVDQHGKPFTMEMVRDWYGWYAVLRKMGYELGDSGIPHISRKDIKAFDCRRRPGAPELRDVKAAYAQSLADDQEDDHV